MDGPLMRKINGKLFLLLLIGSVLVTGSVLAIHAFQYQRIGQALLWQARRAEEQGQPARAARYLQRYLEFNPKDITEKAQLARLWTSEAHPPGTKPRREALRLLDEVLRQQDNPELKRLLIRTAVEEGDFTLARSHLQQLLPWQEIESWINQEKGSRGPKSDVALREDPVRGELTSHWGQILEFEKKPEEAIICYRRALRQAPEKQISFVRLAYLLRRLNETDPIRRQQNTEEADRVIDQLVQNNRSSHEAYLARWRYHRDFDLMKIAETGNKGRLDLTTAAEDVVQALKRRPEAIEVLLAAADLERLRSRAASDDPARTPEERRAAIIEHRQRALQYLQRGQELASQNQSIAGELATFQLLWQKGNLLLDDLDLQRLQREEGKPVPDVSKVKDEITAVISQVRKSHVPAAGDYMQARLFVYEQRWAEAATLFERARAQLSSQRDLACQADLYLGQCYERLEEHTQMFNAFQRVLQYDPTSVPALLGMAAARWSQGQLDQALAQYQAVMKQKRVPARAWIDIARLEIQRQVQNPTPDWTQAEKILQTASEALPEKPVELTLLRAEILVRQNRSGDARKLLQAAQQKQPKEAEYWTALIDLALREKNLELAQQTLQQARRSLSDQVSLRLAEGRILASDKGIQATSRIVQLAKNLDRFSPEDQGRLYTGLAETLYRMGRTEEARGLWREMARLPQQQHDLRLQMLLFDLAMKENDEQDLQRTLANIRAIEQSSGAYHRYGQALYLIWQAKRAADLPQRTELLGQARQELETVLLQRPSWPAVFLARAEIAELIGNPEQAIKDLQEALKNGENSPSVLRRLVTLLTQRGRDGEAQFLLAKLHQSVLYSTDLGRYAVAMAIRRGETAQALDMMRQVVREDTKDPQDLVWMARVLSAAGPRHTAEAEKRLREALQSGSGEPAPWLAMVQFLVSQKRKEEALALTAKAKESLPAGKAALTLARCYDLIGQPAQALPYYQEALKGKSDSETVRTVATAHLSANRAREAEPLLRQLIAGESKPMRIEDQVWAKHALAMLLASGTDYQRFAEALQLVGLRLDASGRLVRDENPEESVEKRRARARVLASQDQKQFRRRAIEILEELQREKALTPDDAFVLALLYEAEGETRKSLDKLQQLTQPNLRTPQYLAQYAMSLVTSQRHPDALKEAQRVIGWLEELERQREVGPNSFATVELRARLLEAQGKGEEALTLLQKHTSREEAKPEEVLLVLASLSRQKRYQEAFELCEQTWKKGQCLPEAIGSVSVSLLRIMNPTDAQVATVEKHLQQAIQKKPESTVLLMHLSDLYDKRGQYDKAADIYRQVLRREPNNVVALNNLAWLLAHRSGDADQALQYINKAVAGMGRRADLLDTRALVYLARKETDKALEDLREATEEAPTPTRLFHLAMAHHALKDNSKAREVLKQAKEKGLQITALHPVEQESARRLLEEYGLR